MRLLHTSDWHLGQSFHQFDRRAEHQAFLDWLLGVLEAEAVDALLIAGDVFDNSNPSAQAQAQLYRFLAEARRRVPQLGIVMTAGNHDSPGRLEAPAPLLSVFDASVIGQVGRRGDVDAALGRLLVPLKDAAGREAAWCIAMPFLRPDDLPASRAPTTLRGRRRRLYRRAFELAAERRQPGQAIVAIGHCHLAGGEVSEDSERRIVIGGAEALPAGIFDPRSPTWRWATCTGPKESAATRPAATAAARCRCPSPRSATATRWCWWTWRARASPKPASLMVPRSVDLLQVPARPAPLDAAPGCARRARPARPPRGPVAYLHVRVQLEGPEPACAPASREAIAGKPVRLPASKPPPCAARCPTRRRPCRWTSSTPSSPQAFFFAALASSASAATRRPS